MSNQQRPPIGIDCNGCTKLIHCYDNYRYRTYITNM